MKQILARIILGLGAIALFGILIYRLIIQPCIELYAKHGLLGIGGWFVVLAIVGCVLYCVIEIIGWAIDNS